MVQAQGGPTVRLADEVIMPLVGFGTWSLRDEQAYTAVRTALEVGYRHIDTATMYGNEAAIGRALRDSEVDRSEVFVTTKLPPENVGQERRTIEQSLRDLNTDYVDLWLVHWPPEDAIVPTWQEFLAARDAGLAREVGVSNHSIAQIDELGRATGWVPAVNQVPWSPFQHDGLLLAEHRERGVFVEGYSPLKGSDLNDPVLGKVAERHRVTPAQVVLRWHLEHGIGVIPRSGDEKRIAANFDLFGFSLDEDEVAAIDALAER
ncbi:MAG TPA: aldo/keto reductase [Thermopolyspora sp.]|jgi:Aldo/keto reductases, related to diketogulonate reductase